jgi:hypothetical protein
MLQDLQAFFPAFASGSQEAATVGKYIGHAVNPPMAKVYRME